MSAVTTVCFVLLAGAGVGATIRLVRGPTLADRMVAADVLLLLLVMGIAVDAVRTGRSTYLPVMLVVALLGFVGTTTVARFIEGREP